MSLYGLIFTQNRFAVNNQQAVAAKQNNLFFLAKIAGDSYYSYSS
jgi:hypothetical protein